MASDKPIQDAQADAPPPDAGADASPRPDASPPPCAIPFWLYAAVVLVAATCYLNSLGAEFVFDDSSAIVNNQDLRPETPVTDIFRNDYWGTPIASKRSNKAYRPLTVLTFRLNYALGGLDPFGYHLGNVAAHVAACVLLLLVGRVVFGNITTAGVAALLFATHPVHTEAVAAIVGRQELLCAAFLLATLLAYTRAARAESTSWPWFAVTLALYVAAAMSKETGITVLGLLCAYDVLLLPCERQGRRPLKALLVRQAVIAGAGVAFIAVRAAITVQFGPAFAHVDNPYHFLTGLPKALSYAHLHARYAWLLLWPVGLSADYSYNAIPAVTSLADPRNLAALCLYGAVAAGAGLTCRSPDRNLLLFCLAALIVPFLPVSNVFFPVACVIGERSLYLPSIGFCLLLAYALQRLRRIQGWGPAAARALAGALLALYAARTWLRNPDWSTPERLFTSALRVCPNSAKARLCVGVVRAKQDRLDEAIACFRAALEVEPDYPEAHYCLGKAHADQGRLADAGACYRRALRHRSSHAEANHGLALLLVRQRKYPDAAEHLRRSLRAAPRSARAHNNLANVLCLQGEYPEAERHYREALRLDPANADAHHNLGVTLAAQRKLEEAVVHYRRALELKPDYGKALINLGKTLRAQGDHAAAKRAFRLALALPDVAAEAQANLAKLQPTPNVRGDERTE